MKDMKTGDSLIPTVKTICQAEWAFAYCTVDLSAFADIVHVEGEDVTVNVLKKLCTGSDGVAEGSHQAEQVLGDARTAILAMQVVGTTPGSFGEEPQGPSASHQNPSLHGQAAAAGGHPGVGHSPNAGSHLKKNQNSQAENPKTKH